MADPALNLIVAGLGLALLLLVVNILLVLRRPSHGPDQSAALALLGPLKENADQRLPTIEKTTDTLYRAVIDSAKARSEEEKIVREALTKLQESTKPTPEVLHQLGIVHVELKRLQAVENDLRDLTSVFLTSQGRGRMGEEAIRHLFENLPSDLWSDQLSLNGLRVDFAVHMPNKRLLPIDSKTSGIQAVQEYYSLGEHFSKADDESTRKKLLLEQGKLTTKVRAAVLRKSSEVANYIQPERNTLPLAIQAVPAVCSAS